MKEYILNINFENWQNQLWFMNEDNLETTEKWKKAIEDIKVLKDFSKSPIEFQTKVIEHLNELGFIRVQK